MGKKKRFESARNYKRKHLFSEALAYYRRYPDVFCEDIVGIKLNTYQAILLRAFFRKKYTLWVLSRGLGKTWLGALALVIYCILYRNTLAGVIAPSFRQSKILIEDKIMKEIMNQSEFVRSEISRTMMNMADARVEFYNGSRIMAVPMGDSGDKIRGLRFHVLICDEYAQIKPEVLDLVVNPMMNVRRNYEVGKTDYDDEIGNRLLITSSAYLQHNHLWKTFKQYSEEMAAGNPSYFVAALPYQVGIDVGLFDSDHIEKEKKRLSPVDFDMEYGSIFPRTSEDIWIDPVDLERCSILRNIELAGVAGFEYIMGLDVARVDGGDNTVIHVIKLVWGKDHLEKHLVCTISLNGLKFEEQARWVRRLLKMYPNTIRIFMDTHTIGQGLADELSKPFFDVDDEKHYPPLIDINDEQAVANIQNGVPIIYGIKPTQENNHRMGMAIKKDTQRQTLKLYSSEAGDDLLITKDKKLTQEEERQVLEAEATRRELIQIEAKPRGMYLAFEAPTKRARKDRWSALGLALLGAEYIEEERMLEQEDEEVLLGVSTRR